MSETYTSPNFCLLCVAHTTLGIPSDYKIRIGYCASEWLLLFQSQSHIFGGWGIAFVILTRASLE